MIAVDTTIQIIEKSSNQYVINGNNVNSNKVRALVGGSSIMVFRFPEKDLSLFNKLPDSGSVPVTIQFSSPKEVLRADIVSIKAK